MDIRLQQIPAKQLVVGSRPKTEAKKHFAELLQAEQKPKISKHAQLRMKERNIEISDQKWSQIHSKLQEAKAKGVTDSLVVMDTAALLVSIKNNTVVTAMDRNEADSQLFTNINGTILMK